MKNSKAKCEVFDLALQEFFSYLRILETLIELFFTFNCIGTMRVPEGDLHCQCKLSIFSLSSFGPCIVFWILKKGTCIGKCIFSIFPAVAHQLKCKHTCIEKCRPDFLSTQDFNEEMIRKIIKYRKMSICFLMTRPICIAKSLCSFWENFYDTYIYSFTFLKSRLNPCLYQNCTQNIGWNCSRKK